MSVWSCDRRLASNELLHFPLFAEILKNKIMQVSLFGIQKTDKYFSELSRDKAFLKFTIFDLWPNTSL